MLFIDRFMIGELMKQDANTNINSPDSGGVLGQKLTALAVRATTSAAGFGDHKNSSAGYPWTQRASATFI